MSSTKFSTKVPLQDFGSDPIMVDMENNSMTSTQGSGGNTMDVANTIVEQLGGRKFIAMTGARFFVGDETGVAFRLPGAGGFCKKGINLVRVELDPNDTYTITFSRLSRKQGLPHIKVVAQHHGVYFDMLQSMFTSETGLAVSL
jgi:hypothetical protein